MNPGLKISIEDVQNVLQGEVIKREVLDSESGREAKKQTDKFYRNLNRTKTAKSKLKSQADELQKLE